MIKTMSPIDMLKKVRAHFAEEAEKFLVAERYAGTVWETNVAKEFGEAAREFVVEIDATLRDWE